VTRKKLRKMITVDPDMLDEIRAYAEAERQRLPPCTEFSDTHAIRRLIRAGLELLWKEKATP